jgi:ribose-phosphate pyrophosphokinase
MMKGKFNNMKGIKIFTGSANPTLAKEVCGCMGVDLGQTECGTFSDGEGYTSILETVRGCDVYIIQPTCATGSKEDLNYRSVNDNLMELLIMADAMKRASAGRITAVIPYYGYARQDRKTRPRDPISARLVADLLTKAGVNHVLTVDIHCLQIQGFFEIPMDNLKGGTLFIDYFKKKFSDLSSVVVVSPDIGSVARCRNFSEKIGGLPIAIVDKRREKANVSEVMHIIGDVSGKNVILLDDMVDTAGSLCGAAKALVEVGHAKTVTACASHGVLSGSAIERIENSYLDEVVFLNTISKPKNICSKIKYISVAEMCAKAISHMYEETSMNEIYE